MKRYVVYLLPALLCLSAGCAQYWYQEGKSYEECMKDRADCVEELEKRVAKPDFGDYEYKFVEDCMMRKGYGLVTEDELPLDAKRADPDRTIHYKIKGIAGTIE